MLKRHFSTEPLSDSSYGYRLILGKTVKLAKRQGPRSLSDQGVLNCTVRSWMAGNAVFSGESSVSHSEIAELGDMPPLDRSYL